MGKRGESLTKDGKRFTLCLPRAVFAALSERAAQENESVSAVVRKIVKDALAKNAGQIKAKEVGDA